MTKRIGLIVGREWSFPPAFIEEVNQRNAGVVAEYVKLGAPSMNDPVPYAVFIDRISHEVPYYRTYLKHAVLQGVTVVNNPFMWTADDKFFGAALATKLGVAHPKTMRAAQQGLRPRHQARREPAQPASTRSTGRRSSSTSACPASSRMPTAAAGRMSTSATRWTS